MYILTVWRCMEMHVFWLRIIVTYFLAVNVKVVQQEETFCLVLFWPLFTPQAPRPSTGPHKLRECLPLIIFLRNRLKYALTGDEVKKICMQRFIKIDGKVRTDVTYPAGFMGESWFRTFSSSALEWKQTLNVGWTLNGAGVWLVWTYVRSNDDFSSLSLIILSWNHT